MARTDSRLVPVDELVSEPYRLLLSYPRPSPDIVESRIRQLKELGVTELEFTGPSRIDGVPLLGKGCVGLVIIGVGAAKRIALKIRRVDSGRNNMAREASMLKAANTAGVGPEYIDATADILAMQLIEGHRLPLWLINLKGRGRKARVKSTLGRLLEQCLRLDSKGLDHGELSRAHKNVLIAGGDSPWILDFESASLSRRASNLTSLVQYLFIGGWLAKRMAKILGPVEKGELVECLRLYKKSRKLEDFETILKILNLQ